MRRLLLSAAIAFAATACGKADPEDLEIVRVSDRGYLTNAPVYIADEEGYFAEVGIKLRFSEPPRSSSQTIPLLERGDIDVMLPALNAAFFSAVAQGARSRMVADRGHIAATGCDYGGVMVRRGLFKGVTPTAADLKGKRFSVSPAGSAAYVVDKYLQSLKLTNADINMVRLGERVEAQALAAGSIDAMHVAEPYISELVDQGFQLIGPARLHAAPMHYAVLLYGPTLTVTNRDLGQRFMKAYLRGVAKAAEGLTDRNVEILARRSGVPAERIRRVCMPTVYADGELRASSLLEFQTWLVAKGHLNSVLGAEAGTDMTFARKAAKELGIPPTAK